MRTLLIFTLFLNSIILYGQNDSNVESQQPYIEVTGTAEREVIPDRIFISITLEEKTVDRKTYTIQEQENTLKSIVKSLNIGMDKLSLSDSNSKVFYKRRKEKGIVLSKEFILEVSNPEQVNSVFESLSNNNIKEASITKTEHSEIIQIRKEVRIEAIKAAKEKAEYLLVAIDEELGSPLEISEHSNSKAIARNLSNVNFSNTSKYTYKELDKLIFQTIKVKFSYYIKYGIKAKE